MGRHLTGFREGYSKLCSGRKVSGDLRVLLTHVYDQVHTCPADLCLLKDALASPGKSAQDRPSRMLKRTGGLAERGPRC